MKAARAGVLCWLAVLMLGVSRAGAAAHAPSAMVRDINDARRAYGLPPLRYSESLERSSSRFARHLMTSGVFAHATRIMASRRFHSLGEVLGLSPGWRLRRLLMIRLWLQSPEHRPVLLSRTSAYVGAGRARGWFNERPTTIWVVQFGAR
jgi:uncharacterized protein YkwD